MVVIKRDISWRDHGFKLHFFSHREGGWCQVKSVATGKECCVPSNNIAKISH
ncbi:hypothetical protein E2320_009786, partial [Naja naja]